MFRTCNTKAAKRFLAKALFQCGGGIMGEVRLIERDFGIDTA